MKVVIDANVLIACFGKSSPFRKIFDAFLNYQFTLLLSNDTLLEYLEIIQQKTNHFIAENIVMSLLSAGNSELHEIFFHWSLIEFDKEDNKFCDLAVAGNADYLVTNDAHFNVVKLNEFPPIKVISADEFIKILS
jgi:putative PIN family toxin of toxin-antitoxin system